MRTLTVAVCPTAYTDCANLALRGSPGHIEDTTMTLFDADGTTALAQNDDGPVGAVNSYIEYTPTANIIGATILVAPKTRQDRGTFQLQVSVTEPDLTIRPPPPPPLGGGTGGSSGGTGGYSFCFGAYNDATTIEDFESTGSVTLPNGCSPTISYCSAGKAVDLSLEVSI